MYHISIELSRDGWQTLKVQQYMNQTKTKKFNKTCLHLFYVVL